ncbi:hypothetical protein [Nonomuraea sp. LPB2021202275-12-8]|uniref:hypothetical protein n=1 Tax=Nonomuraea sp. LPB2021202275-12-8 TaxID=3120159 RepID=UPI00300D6D3D
MTVLAPTTPEFLGLDADNLIAIASALIAVIGVGVAAVIAQRSAIAAKKSAAAAEASAAEAATISHIERERRHDDLAPQHPIEIVAKREKRSGVRPDLYGSITIGRNYRVQGVAWDGKSFTSLNLPLLLLANQPQRFFIEPAPVGSNGLVTQEVHLRFWPPVAELDGVDGWTCPCDRPTASGVQEPPHWELRIPVSYQRPPQIRGF